MSNYTTSLGLEEINPGDQAGLWGNTTNNNLALLDQAIAGVTPVYLDSKSGFTYVLTNYNGAFDESRAAVINVTYQSTQATGANIIQIPSAQKLYVFRNSSGQGITVQTVAATYTVTLANGEATLVFCDGLNAYPGIATAGVGTLTVPYGGTGVTAFSSTPGFVYTAGGTSALTSVSAVSLNSSVAGTLPVANGGTGTTSLTSGALVVGNGTGNVGTLAGSASGQVATWNGSTWTAATPSSAGVTSISGTNIAVSNPTGAVNLSLTSTGIGNALGYTPANAATSVSTSANNTFTGSNTFTNAVTVPSVNFASSTATITTASGNSVVMNNAVGMGGTTVFGPLTTNSVNLGGTTNRWNQIFAGTFGLDSLGTITAPGIRNVSGNGALGLTDGAVALNYGSFTSIYSNGTTAMGFSISTSGTNEVLQLQAAGVIVNGGYALRPSTNGVSNLGDPSFRWNTVYAANGSINTSDSNQKTEIANLDEAEKRVATRIKGLIKKFKFKDAVAKKGSAARIHVGVIAQEVGDAFTAEGLDPHQYALFCYDEWEATEAQYYNDGKLMQAAKEAGSAYGIRYDELLAFVISAL